MVLVEGYFDFAQVLQECRLPVVATCGTALTPQQAQLLRRFVSKVVLSFDPGRRRPGRGGAVVRAAGRGGVPGERGGAARRRRPGHVHPQPNGGRQYAAQLQQSKPYLEYLLDRTAAAHDLRNDESRRAFLQEMLAVAARIPDAAARDQFADRIAHRARITESVVRDEIRKAAVERRTEVSARETARRSAS